MANQEDKKTIDKRTNRLNKKDGLLLAYIREDTAIVTNQEDKKTNGNFTSRMCSWSLYTPPTNVPNIA